MFELNGDYELVLQRLGIVFILQYIPQYLILGLQQYILCQGTVQFARK